MKESNSQKEPSFPPAFLPVFFPVLVSGLFSQIWPIVSTALISHRLDLNALSSVGALAPYSVLQSALFVGLGTGIALRLSLAVNRGAGTQEREFSGPEATEKNSARLIVTLSLMAGGILAVLAGPLCRLAGISAELMEPCTRYLSVLLSGSGLITLKTALLQTHQNTGHARTASLLSMAGIVLQSGFAILLFLCFPGRTWYVPMSTLLTNLVTSLWMYILLRRRLRKGRLSAGTRGPVNSHFKDLLGEAGEMMRLGLSRSGLMLLIGLGGFFLQRSINSLPADIISGHSCGNIVVNLFMEPLNAMAVFATVTVTRGDQAGGFGGILRTERQLLLRAAVYCAAVLLVLPLAGRPLLSFLSGEAAGSAAVSAGYLRLVVTLPLFWPLAVYLTGRNILQLFQPKVLYLLGGCEFLCEMAGAGAVKRVGYAAAPVSIAAAWTAGMGICAWFLWKERAGERNGEGTGQQRNEAAKEQSGEGTGRQRNGAAKEQSTEEAGRQRNESVKEGENGHLD